MCGIVGFISDKQEKGLIDKITQSISHRGPDEIRTSIYPISRKSIKITWLFFIIFTP